MFFFFFFFSSRRRHTRCSRDWSSDVCSSDLLRETPTLTRGCLTRFLLGALAGTGFCLRPLLTLALFLGLARGLGLQPEALGGEPLLLGSPLLPGGLLLGSQLLPGGLFPGKLLGALTLEALARGALLGFPPGPGLPLFFRDLGAALGLSDLTAHQQRRLERQRPAAKVKVAPETNSGSVPELHERLPSTALRSPSKSPRQENGLGGKSPKLLM